MPARMSFLNMVLYIRSDESRTVDKAMLKCLKLYRSVSVLVFVESPLKVERTGLKGTY